MTMISNPMNRWRDLLVASVVAAALAACSKSEPKRDDTDHAPAAGSGSAPAAPAPATPATPHGNHEAAHGGVVMMDATYHVEIVLDPGAGKHRVYVSNGARDPLPASTFDSVTLTVAGEELAMSRAADDTTWQASGKPAPTSGAKVSIAYAKGGQEVARFADLPIEYVLTGKMPGDGATATHEAGEAGEHAHQAPHGGLVKTTTGGHIELVADQTGAFKVWLLDGALTPRAIDEASVTIKVAAKGYADVAPVRTGDHFEGKGAPIPGEHAAAIVTATSGGKTETARFELHLESGAAEPTHGEHAGH